MNQMSIEREIQYHSDQIQASQHKIKHHKDAIKDIMEIIDDHDRERTFLKKMRV